MLHDGEQERRRHAEAKGNTKAAWAAYLCSAVGFLLMAVMAALYVQRSYALRAAQQRHHARIERSLADPEWRRDDTGLPECATLVQAYGLAGFDDGDARQGTPHKTVYSPASKSCYCSPGRLDLDKLRVGASEQEANSENRGHVYVYDTFSCEEVERFNAYAALFNGVVAACWLVMMVGTARRRKARKRRPDCECGFVGRSSKGAIIHRTIMARV